MTALVAVPRLWLLPHGLPQLATSDGLQVVGRTDLILHGHLPPTYDWPSGSMVLLAGALRVLGLFDSSFLVSGSYAQLVAARAMSVAAGVGLCVVTGLLALRLASRPGRAAHVPAWAASLVIGVAFIAFRMSDFAHPEILQAFFATSAVLAAVAYLGRPRTWLALSAGALAGLAGAMKYVGGLALIVVVAAAMASHEPLRRRLCDAAVAFIASALVFLAFVPAVIVDWHAFAQGVDGQFLHQAGGHLGYDNSGPAIGFDLTQALPGSIGWALAIACLIGVVVGAARGLGGLRGSRGSGGLGGLRGSGGLRLAALYVVIELGVLGASHVVFPHYLLVVLPVLVAAGLASLWRFVPAGRWWDAIVACVVVAALIPTVVADARLFAAYRDPDTRMLAAPIVASLDAPVIKGPYTDTSGKGEIVSSLGDDPAATSCHCYVVISSYMEERYRREPVRYRSEVAVYNEIRREGRIVAVVAPTKPLSYRWDLLPQWGVDSISFDKEVVGPKITIFKMP